jgi:predicted O-methyltransferase YrrM
MHSCTNQPWLVARSVAKTLSDCVFFPRLHADKRALDEIRQLPELVPAICGNRGRGRILANQNPAELAALLGYLSRRPPRVIVEIGTAKGGTLYLWSRVASLGGLVVSIDKPGETGSVGRPSLSLFRQFGGERGVEISTVAMDSHAPATHDRLRGILRGKKIDFLFIDGDHRYEGVKADFDGYRKYMAPDGIIAMHDIAVTPTAEDIVVSRFWAELEKSGLKTRSLVAKPGQTPGIGVVLLQ